MKCRNTVKTEVACKSCSPAEARRRGAWHEAIEAIESIEAVETVEDSQGTMRHTRAARATPMEGVASVALCSAVDGSVVLLACSAGWNPRLPAC